MGILVPACFGTRLGVPLTACKRVSKRMGFKKRKNFLNFDNSHFGTRLFRYLSGTESAILNRESGDSESCDSNRLIPRSS